MKSPSPEVAKERDAPWIALTDDDRDRAFQTLPDMLDGFMKKWGWLHFAKAIEDICREKNASTAAKADAGEDARDAARYRWLRAAWLEDVDAGEDVAWSPIMHSCSEEQMDADIDRAIAASPKTNGGN